MWKLAWLWVVSLDHVTKQARLVCGIHYQRSIDNALFVILILGVLVPLSYRPSAIGPAVKKPEKRLISSVLTTPYVNAVVVACVRHFLPSTRHLYCVVAKSFAHNGGLLTWDEQPIRCHKFGFSDGIIAGFVFIDK